MKPFLLKSKYQVQELLHEDMISFCYSGITSYIETPILVWKYKADFLNASLVKTLIDTCEQHFQLDHPHILKLLDYYYDGENFYVIHAGVTKFITLDTYLKQSTELDLKRLWKYSTQLLNALVYIEQAQLYCGGVNVSTIILAQDQQIYITRLMLPILIYKANWKHLDVLEDCVFLAPEFLQSRQFSARSDMYGFGVLMYVFFSQSWPYKYTIKIKSMQRALIEGPKEFKPAHPKIPDRLKRIIDVCLLPDPQFRLKSFVELIKVYRDNLAIQRQIDEPSTVLKDMQAYMRQQSQGVFHGVLRYAIFTLCIFALFFISLSTYNYYITAIPEVAVPQLIGMEAKLAEQRLEEYKLSSLIVGTRFHPSIEKGLIIESKPPSGRVVKQKRVVRLFVSKGQGPILVPDLIGYSKQYIEEKLVGKGLQTEIVDEFYSLQYARGTVIQQIPLANTFIGPSENIRLTLSKGYPVEVKISKARSSFFQNKDHLRKVVVEFFKMDGWIDQEVSIYYQIDDQKDKLYSDVLVSGDALQLEFELEKNAFIEIYFNDELTIRRKIESNVTINDGRI